MNTEQKLVTSICQSVGFYRASEAAKLCAVSKATFWLWVAKKTLCGVDVPQPIKLSVGITVWRMCDIHVFIDHLAAQAKSAPPRSAA
jgi:predicted DNA-binding transcriptional regulator AlpA